MGASKDKKKKAAKKEKQRQQNSVENNSSSSNNKKQTKNKAQEVVGKNNTNQVKITISDNGDTIVLKRINDSYICTNCLDSFNISANKVKNTSTYSTGKSLPHECSACHIKEIESAITTGSSGSGSGKGKNKIIIEDEDDIKNQMVIGDGVKGLSNLGNTCFFNSIMQNLTHLNILRDLFLKEPGSVNSKIHSSGSLTMEMYYFINKMYKSKQPTISPSGLFSEIAKKSPRFRGFKQQDSHELLRYLLDGLISEEQNQTKRRKDPTYIDKIFGGQLISVITCFHCGYISKTFEPFLDLSLPIPSDSSSSSSSNKSKGSFVMPRISTPPQLLKKANSDTINSILKAHEESTTDNSLTSSPVVISTSSSPSLTTSNNNVRISKHQKKKLARDQKRKEEQELLAIVAEVESTPTVSKEDATESAAKIETESIDDITIIDSSITTGTITETNATTSNCSSAIGSPLFGSIDGASAFGNEDKIQDVDIENDNPIFKVDSYSNINGSDNSIKNINIIDVDSDEDNDNDIPMIIQSPIIQTVECTTIDENSEKVEKEIITTPVDITPTITAIDQSGNLCLKIIENYNNDDDEEIEVIDDNSNNGAGNDLEIQSPIPQQTTTNTATTTSINQTPNSGHKRSISDLEKSFETIKISEYNDNEEEEEDDHIKEPVDLRKDIPIEAYNANTLLSCLLQFTNPEKLEGENGFTCSNCKRIYKEKQEEIKEKQRLIKEKEDILRKQQQQQEEQEEKFNKLQSLEIDEDGSNINLSTSSSTTPIVTGSGDINIEESKPVDKKNKKKSSAKEKKSNSSKKRNDDDDDIDKFRRNASKQYLLSSTPPYLTIQLKRFMQTKLGFQKNSKRIEFPSLLDLTSFTDHQVNDKKENKDNSNKEDDNNSKEDKEEDKEENKDEKDEEEIVYINHSKNNHKYQLNGIVEHMGGMGSGHYVAYIYDDSNETWYYISDSVVRESSLKTVISNEPYLLFYRKDGVKTSDIFNSIKRLILDNNKDNNSNSKVEIKVEKIDKEDLPILVENLKEKENEKECDEELKPKIQEPIIEESHTGFNTSNNMYNSLFDVDDDYDQALSPPHSTKNSLDEID